MRKAYDLAFWDAVKVKDALSHVRDLKSGDAKSVHMHLLDYVDLRKLASNVLGINTKAGDLKRGFMGDIYGVSIYAKRSYVQGVMSFFGKDEIPLSHVVNPRRWSGHPDGGQWSSQPPGDHSLLFHAGAFSSCPDGLCLSMLVMVS